MSKLDELEKLEKDARAAMNALPALVLIAKEAKSLADECNIVREYSPTMALTKAQTQALEALEKALTALCPPSSR